MKQKPTKADVRKAVRVAVKAVTAARRLALSVEDAAAYLVSDIDDASVSIAHAQIDCSAKRWGRK